MASRYMSAPSERKFQGQIRLGLLPHGWTIYRGHDHFRGIAQRAEQNEFEEANVSDIICVLFPTFFRPYPTGVAVEVKYFKQGYKWSQLRPGQRDWARTWWIPEGKPGAAGGVYWVAIIGGTSRPNATNDPLRRRAWLLDLDIYERFEREFLAQTSGLGTIPLTEGALERPRKVVREFNLYLDVLLAEYELPWSPSCASQKGHFAIPKTHDFYQTYHLEGGQNGTINNPA